MKKYYGVTESDLKNQIRNRFYRFLAFVKGYVLFDGKKRQYAKEDYYHKYVEERWHRDRDNSIPEGKYYTPVCFIAHDIIPKEYLEEFTRKSEKLLKRNMYGDYSIRFEDDRHKLKESIDKYAWNYDTWSKVGNISFPNDRVLRKHIKYIDMKIMNVSVSYFALQVVVYLTPERRVEIENIINYNYDTDKYHTSLFLRPKKNGGATTGWTVARYNEEHLKSEAIDAMMIETKWLLFNKLSKWFRLQLHCNNIMPPSINVYKTNIHYNDEAATKFFYSVGLKKWDGEFLRESAKIFFDIDRS